MSELSNNYHIPRLIAGAWQLSTGHALKGGIDLKEAKEAFIKLLDSGLNTFDGADIYGGVEDFFGSIVKERKKEGKSLPQIHTKFVPDLNDLKNVDYKYVEDIILRSISRTQKGYLDLVQFHWWDYKVAGMVDVAGYLMRLKEKGLIHHIGTTNMNTAHLKELIEAGIEVESNQCQYSLLDARPSKKLAQYAKENGIKLLCYGTVAGGFLSEKYLGLKEPKDFENRSLVKYKLVIDDTLGWDGYQQLLALTQSIGKKEGLSISQVATLFVLEKQTQASAIVGTRNAKHVKEMIEIKDKRLSAESVAKLDEYLSQAKDLPGDCFDIEREPESKHLKIMKMNLIRKD